MAGYSELTIEQGATFSTDITISEPTGNARDLSDYTASSQMRKSYYSNTAVSLNATVSNPTSGIVTIGLTAAQSANVSPGRYVYDVIITENSNVTRVVEGIITVLPSVTR